MPIFFLILGVLFIIVAINDKVSDFGKLIKDDFTGDQSFIVWIVAIFVIGSIGYIKGLKPVANAFLLLLILVMFLSNKGFFDKFSSAIKEG